MQAILRRTARAQARAAKRIDKQKRMEARERRAELKKAKHDFLMMRKSLRDEALAAAKMDWKLGPLAPKRQLDSTYGTISSQILAPPQKPFKLIPEGMPVLMNKFLRGDRVVVTK